MNPLVNVSILVVGIILTLVVLTVYLYYRNASYSCNASPFFYCYTDWQCDAGTTDATGNTVTNIGCHLKALYGELTDADDCQGFNNRSNPCTQAVEPTEDGGTPTFCNNGSVTSNYSDPYNSCSCNNGANVNALFDVNGLSEDPDAGCNPDSANCYNPNTTSCRGLPELSGVCRPETANDN